MAAMVRHRNNGTGREAQGRRKDVGTVLGTGIATFHDDCQGCLGSDLGLVTGLRHIQAACRKECDQVTTMHHLSDMRCHVESSCTAELNLTEPVTMHDDS